MIIILFSLFFSFLVLYFFFADSSKKNISSCRFPSFFNRAKDSESNTPKDNDPKKEVKLAFDFILFDAGMSHLNDKNKENLIKIIQQAPVIQGNYVLEIMGLADRTGDKSRNVNLAKYRGISVYNFLLKNGFPKENLRLLKHEVVNGNTKEERTKFRSVRLFLN